MAQNKARFHKEGRRYRRGERNARVDRGLDSVDGAWFFRFRRIVNRRVHLDKNKARFYKEGGGTGGGRGTREWVGGRIWGRVISGQLMLPTKRLAMPRIVSLQAPTVGTRERHVNWRRSWGKLRRRLGNECALPRMEVMHMCRRNAKLHLATDETQRGEAATINIQDWLLSVASGNRPSVRY